MAIDREKVKKVLLKHLLLALTVVGVFAGLVLGFVLRSFSREIWWTRREVMYVQFVGDLYLRILNCLVVPLVVSAVVSSVGTLELKTSWKIALRSALWFVFIVYLAVLEGIFLVVTIRPGSGKSIEQNLSIEATRNILPTDTVLDIFRNFFPPNLVESSLVQYSTVLIPSENESLPLEDWTISYKYHSNTNILGLITFSIFLGLAVAVMNVNSRPIVEFFETLLKSMMLAVNWALWLTPLGVMSLIAAKLLEMKELAPLFEKLGLYFITVLIGLVLHGLFVLPTLYFVLTRKSSFKFLGNMSQALVTAFGTSSSGATLPVTMDCLEEKNKIDPRIVRFTVSMGTMSFDGTALYEVVAVVFLAQLRGVIFNFGQLLVASMTVTAACLGGAAVPQAGLMIMVMILTSMGLPPEDVAIIVAIDWLLDRFRTTVNVVSDAFAAGIVEHYSKADLDNLVYTPIRQEEFEMSDKRQT